MEYYNEPAAVLGDVQVAVNSCWADPEQAARIVISDRPYQVVSPVEKLHAVLFAIQRDMSEGHMDKLVQWKKIVLSTTMVFSIQENDEAMRWQALNLREQPGIEYDLVRFGALQRVIEIRDFVSKRPELNGSNRTMAKIIAEAYNKKIKLSKFSESLSDTMVFQCLEVYDRILVRSPVILSMLHEMDSKLGARNPFDKVARLYALSSKCTGAISQAEWVFTYLKDLYEGGKMGSDDFGKRVLAGADSKQKGIADLILVKKSALSRLLSWGSSRIKEAEMKAMHAMTNTVGDFRAAVGRVWSRAAPMKVPMPWRAGWTRAGDALLGFIENFVFGVQYDEVIQTWMHRRKPLDELFEMESIADEMALIEAAGKEEQATVEEAKPVVQGSMEPDSGEAVTADELRHGIESDPNLAEVFNQSLRESTEPGDMEDLRRLEHYKLQAKQYVSTYVTLMDENCLNGEITKGLRTSAAGRAEGDLGQRSHVLIYYSAQDAGESSSQPWCRVPPLRERGAHLERFIRLVLQRFPNYQEELHPRDVYIVNDAGRAGNRNAILKAFTLPGNDLEAKTTIQLKKKVKSVSLLLSEASLAQNKAKVRGQAIEQVQTLLQVTKTSPELNPHDRLHVQHSTNRGNAIGFMSSECWETSSHVWRVQQKVKLEMLGKHGAKVPVGGGIKKKESAEQEDGEAEDDEPAPHGPIRGLRGAAPRIRLCGGNLNGQRWQVGQSLPVQASSLLWTCLQRVPPAEPHAAFGEAVLRDDGGPRVQDAHPRAEQARVARGRSGRRGRRRRGPGPEEEWQSQEGPQERWQ